MDRGARRSTFHGAAKSQTHPSDLTTTTTFIQCVCVCVCVCAGTHAYVPSHFSPAQPFVTPWAIPHKAAQSMGFSWQEYWSGLPSPSPEDLSDPESKPASPVSPALQVHFYRWAKEARVCVCVCVRVCVCTLLLWTTLGGITIPVLEALKLFVLEKCLYRKKLSGSLF